MTLSSIFNGLGDIFQWTFTFLQNDMGLTAMMNSAILIGGFVGFFIWMRKQMKYNAEAESNADQLK